MPIKADCSSCGHSFNAPSKYAGKKVKCPKCKDPLTIPAKASAVKEASSKPSSAKVAVKCSCGKKFAAKAELAGKKVKCPGCGEPIRIPAPKASKTAKSTKSKSSLAPPADDAGVGGLFDEVGFNIVDNTTYKKCPECKSKMEEEAILCIKCGYNESLGRKMVTKRPVTQQDRDSAHEEKTLTGAPTTSKKGKKGKKGSGKPSRFSGMSSTTMTLIIAAGIPLASVVLGFVIGAFDQQIGALVFGIGLLITLLLAVCGRLWLLSIGFKESAMHGILMLFVPFELYVLFFVATNWEETKDAVVLYAVPLVLFFGSVVIFGPMFGFDGA